MNEIFIYVCKMKIVYKKETLYKELWKDPKLCFDVYKHKIMYLKLFLSVLNIPITFLFLTSQYLPYFFNKTYTPNRIYIYIYNV